MKKYNLRTIMTKANALRKVYGMNKSESLKKAWMMAKLEILENELFTYEMKDLDGGKTNTVAHIQIRKNREAIESLQAKIRELKNEIYPRATKTRKVDLLGASRRKLMEEILKKIEVRFGKDSDNYFEMNRKLEDGYEVYTSEVLNENAYSEVA